MRLWSLHPCYLDSKGLVALWRESLLAQEVLRGRTRGYRSHPQLQRFKDSKKPLAGIATYLQEILDEATVRGYHFDARKIARSRTSERIWVTSGQLEYEFDHLLKKLWNRDRMLYRQLQKVRHPRSHPIFSIRPGVVENWEVRY